MNLLLVHEQAPVREILRFGIEANYSVKIFEGKGAAEALALLEQFRANKSALEILKKAGSSNEAMKLLQDKTNFDLIVCQQSPQVPKLLDFLKTHNLATPLVLWETNKSAAPPKSVDSRILKTVVGRDVLPEISTILDELRAGDRSQQGEGDVPLDKVYCPIKTTLLIRVSPLKSDIYIRLSEKKYVKLFPEGSVFDVNDLKKYYNEKRVEFLYLHRDGCAEFVAKFRSDLDDLLNSGEVDVRQADRAVAEAHQTVQDILERTGFTEEVQEIARQSVKLALKVMGETPELMAILARLRENKEKYIMSHSMMLGHVACAISASMAWNSSGTYEKLSMAAFMHDMTLKNQNIAEVQTLKELESRKGEFTEEDIKAYKNHPMEAAGLVRKMNKIPPDVDAIITQHHERMDGSGFPRGLTHSHISHLSCLFIIAHDLTQFLMGNKKKEVLASDMAEFVRLRKDVYTKGNFRKTFEALEKEMQKAASRPNANAAIGG